MNSPNISLRNIRIRLNSNLFGSESGSVNTWYVNPGETFLSGQKLCDYVIYTPLFAGRYRSGTVSSPEPGVMISRKGSRKDRSETWESSDAEFSDNEGVCAYIPLREWREFRELLDRHERHIAKDPEAASLHGDFAEYVRLKKECLDFRMKTGELISEISLLDKKLSESRRETEELRRIITEKSKKKQAATSAMKPELEALQTERILEAVYKRFDRLLSSNETLQDPSVPDMLRRLMTASGAFLSAYHRLSPEDFFLVQSELDDFGSVVRSFETFDREIRSILNDRSLAEDERNERLRRQRQALNKFANTFFRNPEPTPQEAA